MRLCLFCLFVYFVASVSLSQFDPVQPFLGWSSWNTFKTLVTEDIIVSSAETMVSNGLKAAGYKYILIDDGWTLRGARDAEGNIPVDRSKFPSGFQNLTAHVHSLGLLIGIYTSVSATTCGGYVGSLGYEVHDARWFVDMGFDLVKYDTCGTDCGIHTGCIQNATQVMGTALRAESLKAGRQVIFYLDHGNPVNPQKLYNPKNLFVTDEECLVKVATRPQELVWVWASVPGSENWAPHMFKSWFDRSDTWLSMLSNVHNQIRVAEWHKCGFLHFPDMPTCGQGTLSINECRSEFALYTILGTSLILGADIRSQPDDILKLWTNSEMLAIATDSQCIQGSLTDNSQEAGEVWVRPLSDGTFAAVLFNKGLSPQNITLTFNEDGRWNSFYPANFPFAQVRDVFAGNDLGVFGDNYTSFVGAHDAVLLKVVPKMSA